MENVVKIYEPQKHISFILYLCNKKGKDKSLFYACGKSFAIKDYCKANKIDYSECVEYDNRGCHYFEDIGIL